MSAQAQSASKFARFLNSETGPKTIHFWAPVMKWALVIAGINDLSRPVEKLSGTQQIALCATGLIWTRWCLIIKPKNYLLASVNLFLGGVASVQLGRLYNYQRSLGNAPFASVQNILNSSSAKETEPEQLSKVEVASD